MHGQHAGVVAVANGNHTDTVFPCEVYRPIGSNLADHHAVTVVPIDESSRAELPRGFDSRSWIDRTGRESPYVRWYSHDAV